MSTLPGRRKLLSRITELQDTLARVTKAYNFYVEPNDDWKIELDINYIDMLLYYDRAAVVSQAKDKARVIELMGALTALTSAVTMHKEPGAGRGLYTANNEAIAVLKRGNSI